MKLHRYMMCKGVSVGGGYAPAMLKILSMSKNNMLNAKLPKSRIETHCYVCIIVQCRLINFLVASTATQ